MIFPVLVVALAAMAVTVLVQAHHNRGLHAVRGRPAVDFDCNGADRLVYYYHCSENGVPLPPGVELTEQFVNAELDGTIRYIESRYDCSDFRVNVMVRLYLAYERVLCASAKQRIKKTLLGFKYWMDQGGDDSMCYWSENHQILFAVSEYLVGQTFPDAPFAVDGRTGTEHRLMAHRRIEAWIEQRFYFGFVEWYSSNYYPHDIAPMSNLIQFAHDESVATRMTMIMDLLWHDVAAQSFRYSGIDSQTGTPRDFSIFNSSSGRSYSDNRVSDDIGNRMRPFIDFLVYPDDTREAPGGWASSASGTFNCFRQLTETRRSNGQPCYSLPPVIKAIFAHTHNGTVVKSSQSVACTELAALGLVGQKDHQIMMQLAMEAFTNKPLFGNAVRYIAKHRMLRNEFLNGFRIVNLWPLYVFRLFSLVGALLKPATTGTALERSNVYSYITKHYSMHNAQAYHAGEFADQHAISAVNLNNRTTVFTTQPARRQTVSSTPNYWVGNGRNPYSVQERNVLLQIYKPPDQPAFLEDHVVAETTHLFFPTQFFDEIMADDLPRGLLVGRSEHALVAVLSRYPLELQPYGDCETTANPDQLLVRGNAGKTLRRPYDVVQRGPGRHFFVTETSSLEVESFAQFVDRIRANYLHFDQDTDTLVYKTRLHNTTETTELVAIYRTSFAVNGVPVDLEYRRFESPYVPPGYGRRQADEQRFEFQGYGLRLHLRDNIRRMTSPAATTAEPENGR